MRPRLARGAQPTRLLTWSCPRGHENMALYRGRERDGADPLECERRGCELPADLAAALAGWLDARFTQGAGTERTGEDWG